MGNPDLRVDYATLSTLSSALTNLGNTLDGISGLEISQAELGSKEISDAVRDFLTGYEANKKKFTKKTQNMAQQVNQIAVSIADADSQIAQGISVENN
ncbi:hypothetical protein ACFQY8_03240 [Alloscardovia venturai]|uniref:Proteins of 100 residues with WXG n=1 Tax=Alloscardovia venturai TaxID=1769421 RepID=A0ABW2Y9K6_9BIFI